MSPIIEIGDGTIIDLREVYRVSPIMYESCPVTYYIFFKGVEKALGIYEETDIRRADFVKRWREVVSEDCFLAENHQGQRRRRIEVSEE